MWLFGDTHNCALVLAAEYQSWGVSCGVVGEGGGVRDMKEAFSVEVSERILHLWPCGAGFTSHSSKGPSRF